MSYNSGYHSVLPARDSSESPSGSWETLVILVVSCRGALCFQHSPLPSALSPQPRWPQPLTQPFCASTSGHSCQAFPVILLKIPVSLGDKKHYPLFTKVGMYGLQQLSPNKCSLKTILSSNLSKLSPMLQLGSELRFAVTAPFAGSTSMVCQIPCYKMYRQLNPLFCSGLWGFNEY